MPQGSVFAALLFIVYANDLPLIISSIASLFADDSKVYRLLKNISSNLILQSDLDKLVEWATKWKMVFNVDKCSVMHLGYTTPCFDYKMFDPIQGKHLPLKSSSIERDLGVLVDSELNFSKHTTQQVNKANRIMGLVRRSYTFLDSYSFKRLFVSLVRPLLEYCNSITSPRLIGDQQKIESVLRRATKLVPGLYNLTYEERLRKLELPSMLYRLKRGDMIETFKWFQGHYSCEYSPLSEVTRSITRGHNFKLKKQSCRLEIRKHFFSLRIVDSWNSLPEHVVCAPTINTFKNHYNSFLHDQLYVHA